ncbi:MAG: Cephalosporin-C deacetylase [Verrucomicrobia bacterium]|nr:MAG: Cephalosporin-C deacetylase [Verrucomicrobiota bacterium]
MSSLSFAAFFLVPIAALHADSPIKWDLSTLSKAPSTEAAKEANVDGLQSLYVEGLPYQGKPTRFFAYLGFPKNGSGKFPAVVLAHGGGGSAFAEWVKYWNSKGYAAIALDNEGQIPLKTEVNANTPQIAPHWITINSLNLSWQGGPQRYGTFADFSVPLEDQWMYHAVANTIRAVSLLAARPEIDASRIGIVGISWGSVICSTVAGVDERLAFVVPQYIGGHLDMGNVWSGYMNDNPATKLWDPANFYPNPKSKAQWLWINGINDKYGVPTMTTRSWKETGPNSWMSLLPTQGHGHQWKETGKQAVSEIYAFADSVTRGTAPLARITKTTLGKGELTLNWKNVTPLAKAQICFTTDPIPPITVSGEPRKDWEHVKYIVSDLQVPIPTPWADGTQQASFPLPAGFVAGFINLVDERGLSVSSEFQQAQP